MFNIMKSAKKIINRNIFKSLFWTRLNHTEAKVKYPQIKSTSESEKSKEKSLHPYRKIHPWKSKSHFIKSIIEKHVIYNWDGLVAVNKPYGISARIDRNLVKNTEYQSGIHNEVKYTITDALPQLADELKYDSLTIVRCPEKFTSGIVLLSATDKIKKAVEKALERAEKLRLIPRTYWTVTRRVPVSTENEEKEERLAMRLVISPDKKNVMPVIIKRWSHNEQKRREVKILNIQYKVLCNSTLNLASLVEIKSSTTQWHAIRLYAATELLSPILGDRIHGSRAQDVMGRFMKMNPFVEAAHVIPQLDRNLLKILRVTQGKSMMIPVHVHLREIFLPSFLRKGNDIEIKAPLHPEFLWTCRRLKFKEEIFNPVEKEDNTSDTNISSNSEVNNEEQCAAVT
ncbi:mitochondrial mRNA pseudouridine synthase RPUSD3-like [Chelonus insularis]|uniref:mitochondrial mRNA pseudouridine synthase RPUSD3-like n=1 Tax=Chelonus insularis TaxID=460826 RepID=UPI00158AAD97|nr:mitochondrial mRNA pseudouridine synthase RPUSD3-like [Chelonus insularis]